MEHPAQLRVLVTDEKECSNEDDRRDTYFRVWTALCFATLLHGGRVYRAESLPGLNSLPAKSVWRILSVIALRLQLHGFKNSAWQQFGRDQSARTMAAQSLNLCEKSGSHAGTPQLM